MDRDASDASDALDATSLSERFKRSNSTFIGGRYVIFFFKRSIQDIIGIERGDATDATDASFSLSVDYDRRRHSRWGKRNDRRRLSRLAARRDEIIGPTKISASVKRKL